MKKTILLAAMLALGGTQTTQRGAALGAQTPSQPPTQDTVKISPTGSNDTSNWQTTFNAAAAAGKTVEILAGSYQISDVLVPGNSNIVCDPGMNVVDATSVSLGGMLIVNTGTVKISGPCGLSMPKHYAGGHQEMACFLIQDADHVTLSGVTTSGCAGDGVYISRSSNVLIQDSDFVANARNGASLIGQLTNIHLVRSRFNNQHNLAAANIADGIDIEPNRPDDFLKGVLIEDCETAFNQLSGLEWNLQFWTAASQATDMVVNRHNSHDNGSTAKPEKSGSNDYSFRNNGSGANPGGTITCNDCKSTNSAYAGAAGVSWVPNGEIITFNRLSVVNSQRLGDDPKRGYGGIAAVAVGARVDGGSVTTMPGRINFLDLTVSNSNGRMTAYFGMGGAVDSKVTCANCTGATSSSAPKQYP